MQRSRRSSPALKSEASSPSTIDNTECDVKNNKVTVTGPFDAEKLSSWLRCKAGKIIKCIEVQKPPQSPPKPPPCTLVPFPYPYPLPYLMETWKCPTPPPPTCPTPTPPTCPSPPQCPLQCPPPRPCPRPCPPPRCSGCCDHHEDGDCGGCSSKRPCSCRPFVKLPCDYKLVCEDNPSVCSIM